jgi:uncharacterized membrane protein YuzA (DUF378 family)
MFAVSAFLAAFGLFDLIYALFGFQPILFWSNDFLLIGSSAALFVVILVSLEYDSELIQIQESRKNTTQLFVKPMAIGKYAQRMLANTIQPLQQAAINTIQLVSLVGIISYFLGTLYGKQDDNKEAIYIVVGAAVLIVVFVFLEHFVWSKRVWRPANRSHTIGNGENKSILSGPQRLDRSNPVVLSNDSTTGTTGTSQRDFISLLDKVVLSDEFKTGQDD